ncbi:hypothetical protein XA68_17752 [Ophiocordyceps unilateralis]|uniref:Ap4A phosphorylase 1/2 N-terminal domain-containing protein n=1 Tax=Ophiocordyceps unilateralis TaxID=268505 RepID=A0A2A9PP19_OPHUN|nr:hypothetical protein XA68_17752 [Ophiocordyceps unilateralis]
MSRAIKAPATLPELVTTAFSKARADGELLYFPTRVALLPVPMPFQLRFSPAFADKPKKPKTSSPPTDPFANPPASLYVGSVGPGHYVVLNKFAIVAEHFILATNEFQKQTELLALADLEATMACVRAYKQTKRGLFAFFNSGEHSGASQPHRHIQLLPVELPSRRRTLRHLRRGHRPRGSSRTGARVISEAL